MYTQFYIKTENSLLTSMIKISDLVIQAKKLGYNSLSITDNNMYGVMDFYHECIKNNIKPIIGLEVNIDDCKFLLYCINYNGYKNLIKIATSQSDNTLNFDVLKKYSSDLVCIVLYESLNHLYSKLKEIYINIYIGYKNISERNNLDGDNLLYVNETLYLNKDDSKYYKYLVGIRDGLIIDNIKINKDKNFLYPISVLEKLPIKDLENNKKITDMCNLKLEFNLDLLPIYDCPNSLTSYDYLKKLCIDNLNNLFDNNIPSDYLNRLNYEIDVINKMGFCNYFLIVYDYVKFAKENDILVGPGRGSAAGSLVAYSLNITTIDPLKYNLLFERFLNPERISMPDIDIDFEFDKRDMVIEYCVQKYGKKCVAPIITFGTLGSKQVIRDVARVMDIDISLIDNLSKLIDSKINLKGNYEKNIKIRNMLKINRELFDLYKIAYKFEGLKRHKTVHAAGIVMSKIPLDEVIPLDIHDNYYLTGYSMEYLEKIGLLKMDFLALKNLSIISDIIKQINVFDSNINFDNIPLNNESAIEIFKNGYTLGIFQFESMGMINFLKKYEVTNFDDIVAAIALYRPGPIKNIDTYINRKKGLENIDYLHPDLEKILKPTYGIIVYQEQIMQIAVTLANFSLGEADILRKAMSKKNTDLLLSLKEKFINQSIKNGYDKEFVIKIYDFILKFAEYGFNKSHSVSYAMIAYKMAYLKANYREYFMRSLLSGVIGSEQKTKDYIYECKLLGINLLLPDINLSIDNYFIYNNNLLLPLNSIKGIGTSIVKIILDERKNGKFIDIYDFIKRVYDKNINKQTLLNLNDAGCFLSLGISRKKFETNIDLIINYGEIGELLDDDSLKPLLKDCIEFSNKDIMQKELNVFGFYLSKHPVTEYKVKYKVIDLKDISLYFDKNIGLIIYVDKIRVIKTKNNDEMCFISGSDESSNIEIVLFPRVYDLNKNIEIGNVLKIFGKVEKRFDEYQVVVSEIEAIQ